MKTGRLTAAGRARWPALTALLCLLFIGACSAGRYEGGALEELPAAIADSPGMPTLAWPPPSRGSSDDELNFSGSQFTSAGGSFEVVDESVVLSGQDPISYAIYSAGPFTNLLLFDSLRTSFTVDIEGDPDQRVYIGLANYSKQRWQWFVGTPGTRTLKVATPVDYVSPEGEAHCALVSWGSASSTINSVDFLRRGPTETGIPQNLRAEAFVGQIELEWDAVVPCFGYNVYRATNPQFSDAEMINDSLLFDTQYTDSEATTHRMWYYRVTALHAVESDMSNMVDIFSPRIDRPTPLNFRVTAQSLTTITVEWDWHEADPYQWKVYWKGEKDFNLEPPIAIKNQPGFARKGTLDNLVPGEKMWFRIASMDSEGKLGRMTDDLETSTRNLYHWGDVEIVGPGMSPLDLMVADNDMTACYQEYYQVITPGSFGSFLGSGGKIKLSRRDSGTWNTDEVSFMNPELEENEFYVESMDFAYADGKYLIGAHAKYEDSLWTFEGSPGGPWDALRLEGDANTGIAHPVEGLGIRVASNGSEFSLSHLAFTEEELALWRRPVDGLDADWQRRVLRDQNVGVYLNYHSMDYDTQGQLSVMTLDLISGALLVGHEEDDFTFFSILPPQYSYIGAFNDMHYVDGHWFASAFNGPEEKLVLINDGSFPWEVSPVSYRKIEAGNHSRLSSFEGRPMVLYYGTPPEEYLGHEQRWYFGLYEPGGWHTEWIQIEDYEFYDFGPEAEIVDFNGELYFMFEDRSDGMIKCARAVPPQL